MNACTVGLTDTGQALPNHNGQYDCPGPGVHVSKLRGPYAFLGVFIIVCPMDFLASCLLFGAKLSIPLTATMIWPRGRVRFMARLPGEVCGSVYLDHDDSIIITQSKVFAFTRIRSRFSRYSL